MLHRPGLPVRGFLPLTYPDFSFSWEARPPHHGPEVLQPHLQHQGDVSYPGWRSLGPDSMAWLEFHLHWEV